MELEVLYVPTAWPAGTLSVAPTVNSCVPPVLNKPNGETEQVNDERSMVFDPLETGIEPVGSVIL